MGVAVASRCRRCWGSPKNPIAKFCSHCGEMLPVHYIEERPTAGWQSIPVLVRFGIWLMVLPVLLGFASCALIWLGVIASATK